MLKRLHTLSAITLSVQGYAKTDQQILFDFKYAIHNFCTL